MSTVLEPLQDTRQRLLEAACDAFREEGYQVSIDRLAARAHVARQTLYNYFPSKDVLFAEAVRHGGRAGCRYAQGFCTLHGQHRGPDLFA